MVVVESVAFVFEDAVVVAPLAHEILAAAEDGELLVVGEAEVEQGDLWGQAGHC